MNLAFYHIFFKEIQQNAKYQLIYENISGGSWCMDKRILIMGSICAIAILLGVSFTSVVGYSSNKSNSIGVSPLYNIRTNRAIDEEKNAPIFYYIRKEKGITISFPTKDEKTILLHKFIGKIKYIENPLKKKQAIRYIISDFLKNENYNIEQEDITSHCGPTLGLNIFNSPIKLTIKWGVEFAGLGCLHFILIVMVLVLFFALAGILGGWTSDNSYLCNEYSAEYCLI